MNMLFGCFTMTKRKRDEYEIKNLFKETASEKIITLKVGGGEMFFSTVSFKRVRFIFCKIVFKDLTDAFMAFDDASKISSSGPK